jgi:hypothetical protein
MIIRVVETMAPVSSVLVNFVLEELKFIPEFNNFVKPMKNIAVRNTYFALSVAFKWERSSSNLEM